MRRAIFYHFLPRLLGHVNLHRFHKRYNAAQPNGRWPKFYDEADAPRIRPKSSRRIQANHRKASCHEFAKESTGYRRGASVTFLMLRRMPLGDAFALKDSEEAEELQNQHAIAVAVESIALANCFLVGPKQKLAAGKCAHEHEQTRARQMKIRQQKIDGLKPIRRINENVCGAGLGDEFSIAALGRFQDAHDCSSHRCDSTGVVDPGGGRRGNRKVLGMHAMLGDVLRAHGQECSRPDMQRHESVRDLAQDLRGEMETSSRRCERTRCLGENSLVTRSIFSVAVASDLRRQRH
jgi:hypothetical protein